MKATLTNYAIKQISFTALTLIHELALVALLEQIYIVATINEVRDLAVQKLSGIEPSHRPKSDFTHSDIDEIFDARRYKKTTAACLVLDEVESTYKTPTRPPDYGLFQARFKSYLNQHLKSL